MKNSEIYLPSFTLQELQQRLAYENTLILGALGLHDQHRELRLDIDDMSYEVFLFQSYDIFLRNVSASNN